jgi:predicted DNA-binding transcriptional regulator AlpA
MKADVRIDPETLLSSREACSILGCSKVSLWRWMRRDGFPRPLRFSPSNQRSRLRFIRSEIIAWIEEQQRRTTAAKGSPERRGIRSNAAGAGATE